MGNSNQELIWAAGFFDGEGHAGLQQYKYPRVKITQHWSDETLVRFKEAVGFGKIRYDKSREAHRWQYYVSNTPESVIVLNKIYPFLCSIKKKQIDSVLKHVDNIGQYGKYRTHCNNGHEWKEINLRYRKDGFAQCKICCEKRGK